MGCQRPRPGVLERQLRRADAEQYVVHVLQTQSAPLLGLLLTRAHCCDAVSDPDVTLKVYLMGNPIVVWGASAGIVLWMFTGALYLHFRDVVTVPRKAVHSLSMCRYDGFGPRPRVERLCAICACHCSYSRWLGFGLTSPEWILMPLLSNSFAFIAWLCNLAPYILVSRSCFVYHYMPGLLYAELLTALWLDRVSFKYVARVTDKHDDSGAHGYPVPLL